jgi:hypothetical protein
MIPDIGRLTQGRIHVEYDDSRGGSEWAEMAVALPVQSTRAGAGSGFLQGVRASPLNH